MIKTFIKIITVNSAVTLIFYNIVTLLLPQIKDSENFKYIFIVVAISLMLVDFISAGIKKNKEGANPYAE